MDTKISELENKTSELLTFLHEMVYSVEHFVRKTNKSTSLEVRNNLRKLRDVSNGFKNASIKYFKEDGDGGVDNDWYTGTRNYR